MKTIVGAIGLLFLWTAPVSAADLLVADMHLCDLPRQQREKSQDLSLSGKVLSNARLRCVLSEGFKADLPVGEYRGDIAKCTAGILQWDSFVDFKRHDKSTFKVVQSMPDGIRKFELMRCPDQ